jgi:hypothetical protein
MLIFLLVACGNQNVDPVIDNNSIPVASAGEDITTTTDRSISIDGDASFDPDGDAITYNWSFARKPESSSLDEGAFRNNHTPLYQTDFFPDVTGLYIVSLVVIDEQGAESIPDDVIIQVEEGQAPVAVAGRDQNILLGDEVLLDGGSSYDPLGRELTYTWSIASQPQSSETEIANIEDMETSIKPDISGLYLVSLRVDNGGASSEPDVLQISVSANNPQPPEAVVGEDDSGLYTCSNYPLDGSASSDPNGDTLDYFWTLQEKPTESQSDNTSFSDRYTQNPDFFPDKKGEYVLSLAVNDGTSWSNPDMITLEVLNRPTNSPPVVNAGSAISVDAGNAECSESGYVYNCGACSPVNVSIGGNASVNDPDGDPVVYSWSSVEGNIGFLDEKLRETTALISGASPEEPGVCSVTEFQVALTATDCPGASSSDALTINVTCCGIFSAN